MNKFVFSVTGIFIAGIIIISSFIFFNSSQKIPDGESGTGAENLRDEIEKSIHKSDWDSMAALEFTLELNHNRHFIDFNRGFTEVEYRQDNDSYLIQYDKIGNITGTMNGEKLQDDDLKEAYRTAQHFHETDLFWLNPFIYLRENTEIKKVGERALLITFKKRNNDTYLIVTDKQMRPTHWKMWAENMSIKGMESSFDRWQKIKNRDAWISLSHKNDFQEINFTDVIGYDEYPVPGKKDRFSNLILGSSGVNGD